MRGTRPRPDRRRRSRPGGSSRSWSPSISVRRQSGLGEALTEPDRMIERIWQALTSFGPLSELLARTDVEEVFIEGDRVSFIEAGGRLVALNEPTTEAENRHIVDRLLDGTGRRLDATSAIQQAHILDGRARLTAVIEPVSQSAVGHHPHVHRPQRNPRIAGPAGRVVAGGGVVPVVSRPGARLGAVLRTDRGRQDHRPRRLPAGGTPRPVHPHRRRSPRAQPPAVAALLVATRRPGHRPHRRTPLHAAGPHQGVSGHAGRPAVCRRSAGGRSVRAVPCRQRRRRLRLHHPRRLRHQGPRRRCCRPR